MTTAIRILTEAPVVACIADMQLRFEGIQEMAEWVRSRNPECLPEAFDASHIEDLQSLWPESPSTVSDNEALVELAGRKCYNSFGLKAGRKTNAEYIANTQSGDVPHASIMYHAKMTFFIAGVSRRVSHELIRHYVGADRDEEGSPSQESTRYVEHAGCYVAHPAILEIDREMAEFRAAMTYNYGAYRGYITRRSDEFAAEHGKPPAAMDRKRIFESASPYLSHACETSFVWTTNPIALAKLIHERDHEAADLEFRRLAQKWKRIAVAEWPGLFPQPWMQGRSSDG